MRMKVTLAASSLLIVGSVGAVPASAGRSTARAHATEHRTPLGYGYPDPTATPGATLTHRRAAVCAPAHAAHVQPITAAQRQRAFARYAIPKAARSGYTVDREISAGVGGSNAARNLWPQPKAGGQVAAKDRLERRLRTLVCRHRLNLPAAQRALQGDWTRAYARFVGPLAPAPAGPGPAAPPVRIPSVTNGWGTFGGGTFPGALWRPYADRSVWNRGVPGSPKVLANSAAMVAKIFSTGDWATPTAGDADTSSDWMHPVYFSRPSDPVYTVHCNEPWGTCSIEGTQVHIPAVARAAGGGDAHMAVIDQSTGVEHDFWKVQSKPAGGGTLTIGWGGKVNALGTGVDDNHTQSGATAANQGLAAGMVTAAELQAGLIPHALTITVDCTSGMVYPATGTAAQCSGSDWPADGQWLYLALTDGQIQALAVPAWKKTILTAFAHYGAFVTDTGGPNPSLLWISGSSSTSYGVADPMVTYAQAHAGEDISVSGSKYHFDLSAGIDWVHELRALAPPAP